MKIKKEITLTYEIERGFVIFSDLRTLSLALGTQSVAGNLHMYDIKKKDGNYYVPVKALENKYEKKKKFVEKQIEYLEIMGKIVAEINK